ncbi:hypothetical protein B9G69_012140 [Bdellovibrio sp. SKB1291214]|uniref:hypothetical protein n=1 Tax=Bdellovibrio sp. SKB1291214 TaxID=1732569 RepID=UPI00223ECF30|nr:hypothetical protein [Bdellovibrio sp. SKB1291214]UYL07795.1 hypothetical protein B9G69_012140 [Bdellovibrio sp. SKB1291214]
MKLSGFLFLLAFLFFASFPQVEIVGGSDAKIVSVQRLVPSPSLAFEVSNPLRFFKNTDRLPTEFSTVNEFTLEKPELHYGHRDPVYYRYHSLVEFNWSQSRAPPAFNA